MRLTSASANAFLARTKKRALDILSSEMGIKVERSRFHYNRLLYPLEVVLFDDPAKHGYYEHAFFRIGINRQLAFKASDTTLDNILRHELAHLVMALKNPHVPVHGPEFKQLCQSFGWGEEVYSAYAGLDQLNELAPHDESLEKLVSRVKKLLSLASSNNIHEAELATAKANEILLKHNIEHLGREITPADDDWVYCARVIERKKSDAKIGAIYDILRHFCVRPVLSKGGGQVYLEVIGSKTNVELADYIAKFLEMEFERLWESAKSEDPKLKGTIAKNSFFRGVARGFGQKIELSQKAVAKSSDLSLIANQLETQLELFYPRLSSTSAKGKHDQRAHGAGISHGSNLSIRPGISEKKKPAFLEWKK